MDDLYMDPNSLHGHGTTVAILAAGSKSGVAPLADLVIYSHFSVVSEKLATPTGPAEGKLLFSGTRPSSLFFTIENMYRRIVDGRLPAGKTVVNLSLGRCKLCLRQHLVTR
jgi:hypothetical protein